MTQIEGLTGSTETVRLPDKNQFNSLDEKVRDYMVNKAKKNCLTVINSADQIAFFSHIVFYLKKDCPYPKSLEEKLINNVLRCQEVWNSTVWKKNPSSNNDNRFESFNITAGRLLFIANTALEMNNCLLEYLKLSRAPNDYKELEGMADLALAQLNKYTDVAAAEMSNLTEEEWEKIREVFEKNQFSFSSSFKDLAQRKFTTVAA